MNSFRAILISLLLAAPGVAQAASRSTQFAVSGPEESRKSALLDLNKLPGVTAVHELEDGRVHLVEVTYDDAKIQLPALIQVAQKRGVRVSR